MRPTAVFRNGEWIPTDVVAGHNGYPTRPTPPPRLHVISDVITCEHTRRELEMKSMADGRRYSSKSRYRAEMKARGNIEVGTDRQALVERRPDIMASVERDIRVAAEKAWSQLGGDAAG